MCTFAGESSSREKIPASGLPTSMPKKSSLKSSEASRPERYMHFVTEKGRRNNFGHGQEVSIQHGSMAGMLARWFRCNPVGVGELLMVTQGSSLLATLG
jgi:hypothetical protein